MQQYQELIQTVIDTGSWQDNRTGIRTLSVPGAMMRFDLAQGFPAVTTKRLAFKSVCTPIQCCDGSPRRVMMAPAS